MMIEHLLERLGTPEILLVDDDTDNIIVLEQILTDLDLLIYKACSGRDAINLAKCHEFSLIILDVSMPGIDGFKTAELIRHFGKSQKSPIIFLTAVAIREEDPFKGYKVGAVDYLFKPVNQHILRTKVNVFIELSRQKTLLKIQKEDLRISLEKQKKISAELKIAQQHAETINHIKSNFLTSMSHEIRTPMNGIIGITALLLKTDLTCKQKDFVENIRISGKYLMNTVNEIFDYSKIEARKMDLENQPFELRSCVEEAMELLAVKTAEKNLELVCMIEPEVPPFIYGDISRLRQILVNLIGNATKFTEKGEILISVSLEKKNDAEVKLKFSVKDSGIGISKDKLTNIFVAFSQVDTPTTRTFGGTGLGLSISRRLVSLMQGDIWAESKINQGSTFFFTIKTQEASIQTAPYLKQNIPELTSKHILLVDDSVTNLEILQLQCKNWGVLTSATPSPEEAWEWIKSGKNYDLAIVDHRMIPIDGVQLGKRIRTLASKESLPIALLLSTAPYDNSNESELQKIFNAQLTKPVRLATLFNLLIKILIDNSTTLSETTQFNQLNSLGDSIPLRILVAEDNQINQFLTIKLLESFAYTPDIVANGLEVLEAVQQQDYDIILMDVQMPKMDGLETTQKIRKMKFEEKQPTIIAVTANAQPEDRDKCINAGMDDYISKPIIEEELRCVLQRWGKTVAQKQPSEFDDIPVLLDRMALEFPRSLSIQLTDMFFSQAPISLKKIKDHLQNNDLVNIGKEAHLLKGSCLEIGASQMGKLCEILQNKNETLNITDVNNLLIQLETSYDRVKQKLIAIKNTE